ncbi:MAG: hypothetical protein IPM18_12380 [Phycisphaerales bacterium]|nr:hypothetical protein [Phycisphaerales bacterium]
MGSNDRPRSLLGKIDRSGVPLLLARLGVGGWFAYLAILKIMAPANFLKTLRGFEVLPTEPPFLMHAVVIVLPWLELLCAAAVVLGIWRRGAALLINGMLLYFTPLLALHAATLLSDPARAGEFAWYCAVKFDCGCGTGETYICTKLAENLALQVGALIILFSRSRLLVIEALWQRRLKKERRAEAKRQTAAEASAQAGVPPLSPPAPAE